MAQPRQKLLPSERVGISLPKTFHQLAASVHIAELTGYNIVANEIYKVIQLNNTMASVTERLLKPDANWKKRLFDENCIDENSNHANRESSPSSLAKCLDELLRLQEKLQESIKAENDYLPPLDNQDISNQACVFCACFHLPELCSMRVKERIKRLHQNDHCTRCLLKMLPYHLCFTICSQCNGSHNVAICRDKNWLERILKSTKAKFSNPNSFTKKQLLLKERDHVQPSPFEEPDIPDFTDQTTEQLVVHPRSISASLILRNPEHDSDQVCYVPNIVVSAQYKSRLVLARAYINCFTSSVSFVSPRLLTKLKLNAIKMRPIVLDQILGYPTSVNSYVTLELCSLYKPSYRYRQVFYVMDVSYLKVALASNQVKKKVAQLGITLSSELRRDKGTVDLIIGEDQFDLTGLTANSKCTAKLTNDLVVDYSHFGYILTGTEKRVKTDLTDGAINSEPEFLSFDLHRKLL